MSRIPLIENWASATTRPARPAVTSFAGQLSLVNLEQLKRFSRMYTGTITKLNTRPSKLTFIHNTVQIEADALKQEKSARNTNRSGFMDNFGQQKVSVLCARTKATSPSTFSGSTNSSHWARTHSRDRSGAQRGRKHAHDVHRNHRHRLRDAKCEILSGRMPRYRYIYIMPMPTLSYHHTRKWIVV